MFDTLSRNIIYGTTYCSFEHIGAEADTRIKLLTAQHKKGELDILHSVELNGISAIKEQDVKVKHAHLILNNNQVLEKSISLDTALSDSILLNQTFPSIDINEFYYQIIRLDSKAHAFICRKAYVQLLLAQYEEEGIYITNWSIGITPMLYYDTFVENEKTLIISSHKLYYEKGVLKNSTHHQEGIQTESYTLNGLEVHSNYLNTFGGVLASFSEGHAALASNIGQDTQEKTAYYKQHRLYALGLPIAVGTLLIIFLLNFFAYNHYFTKVEQFQAIGDTNVLQRQLLLKKDSIVDQKQKRFEDVIASASSSSSYFLDQVVEEMPETILLNQLTYNPILKKIKPNKPLVFEENTIEIKGSTNQNKELSLWISHLELMDFVKEVSIKNLGNEGRFTNFSLTLVIQS